MKQLILIMAGCLMMAGAGAASELDGGGFQVLSLRMPQSLKGRIAYVDLQVDKQFDQITCHTKNKAGAITGNGVKYTPQKGLVTLTVLVTQPSTEMVVCQAMHW